MPRDHPAFIPGSMRPNVRQQRRPTMARARSPAPHRTWDRYWPSAGLQRESEFKRDWLDARASSCAGILPASTLPATWTPTMTTRRGSRRGRVQGVRLLLPCTANRHLMATVMHLAKPVEVADNPLPRAERCIPARLVRVSSSTSPSHPSSRSGAGPPPSPTCGRAVMGWPEAAMSIPPR